MARRESTDRGHQLTQGGPTCPRRGIQRVMDRGSVAEDVLPQERRQSPHLGSSISPELSPGSKVDLDAQRSALAGRSWSSSEGTGPAPERGGGWQYEGQKPPLSPFFTTTRSHSQMSCGRVTYVAEPHRWNWPPCTRQEERNTGVCVAEKSSFPRWELPARGSFHLPWVTGQSHWQQGHETHRCPQCCHLANVSAGD